MKVKHLFKKFTSWHLWLNLLGMVAAVIIVLVGLKWWLLSYTHHGESIEVPDLYGKDYRVATTEVEELGLRIMANDSTYIKDKPAGCVVVQSPAKGMSSYRQALATLRALEFRVASPKLIDGDKDWVYGLQCEGRNLHAGDMVARESIITLIIGNGATDEYDFYDDTEDIPEGENGDIGEEDDFEPVDMNDIFDEP